MYGTIPPYQAYSVYGTNAYWGCVGCSGGCYGCYGGWSCYGSPLRVAPAAPAAKILVPPTDELPVPPREEKKPEKKIDKKDDKKDLLLPPEGRRIGNWATIVLQVPADARIFIDGQEMTSKATRRVYQTPILEPGETYYYDVRAEVVRNGKTITENRRVILNPGQRIAANFDDLGSSPPPAVAQVEDD